MQRICSVSVIMGLCVMATMHQSIAAVAAPPPGLHADELRTEYLVNPIGIDETSPRFSWILTDSARNSSQSAYQILAASSEALLEEGKADLWDSGKVESNQTNQIEYKGKPLVSRQICYWRVRAWDQAKAPGTFSSPAHFEMGLLEPSDWDAKWIRGNATAAAKDLTIVQALYQTIDGKISKDVTLAVKQLVHGESLQTAVTNDVLGGDPAENRVKQLRLKYSMGGKSIEEIYGEKQPVNIPRKPLSYLRREFSVSKPITRARIYVSALGIYELDLNGQRVGDHVLAPDWTLYPRRIRYQVYDVTADVKQGANALGAMIADGWYCGHIGNGGYRYWGKSPSLIAQLEITHDDGSIERISTDSQWKAHISPVLDSDIMMGEDYDARLELAGWSLPGLRPDLLNDEQWKPIDLTDDTNREMDAQVSPPVHQLMALSPKTLTEPQPGHYLFDLGQNMVGVPRIKVTAPAGTRITIKYAEMLNSDKSIYTTNYRGARSIDTYICKGSGVETWQPRFTFHGFRYVELTGLPSRPRPDAVTGIVIGSDTPAAGQFTCSDPRINQLQSNIQWGQRGNFLSVPTDCPQRDERLGWMGDAQVFIGTAIYNADVASFFSKWLVDVDDAQTGDGQFTNVSPDNGAGSGTPGWGDAGVVCPWTIYKTYGDKRLLQKHLPNMMRWVDWCKEHSDNLIRSRDRGSDFGDWLSIGADTSKELMGTAYFAYSTHLVAESAKAIGDEPNAAKYSELFDQIKAAFNQRYVHSDGRISGETQTGYAMALAFDLLPESDRVAAAARLADNVREKKSHLSTGFLGVSYLLPALSNRGQLDTAYALLFQDTFPSWLFSVSHGATTIWERWDGWTPEKGFQDPGMNSFNHYSLGSCGKWLYENVAGISQAPDSTGYERIVIKPQIGKALTSAAAHYDSIRGRIASEWQIKSGRLLLTVTVPVNVTATVHVPTANTANVTESGKPAAQASGVKVLPAEAGAAVFEVGSGTYVFNAVMPKLN